MNTRKQEDSKNQRTIVNSFYMAIKSFGTTLPMLLGVILLLGLFSVFVTSEMISSVFTGELLRDTVIGSLIGSISAGNSIVSYIIGGELLKEQVSLFAVTAFIVAWVTVGVLQFPAEATILGKRFAIARNILGFILAIVVSIATVTTLTLMPIP
ncbi:MAG: permease [Euryarchaeota archaeon]|nr:permease [Euryarchaeota archaeon]